MSEGSEKSQDNCVPVRRHLGAARAGGPVASSQPHTCRDGCNRGWLKSASSPRSDPWPGVAKWTLHGVVKLTVEHEGRRTKIFPKGGPDQSLRETENVGAEPEGTQGWALKMKEETQDKDTSSL